MDIINSWLRRDFFLKASLLYMMLLILIGIMRYSYLPSATLISVQVVYIVLVLIFSQLYSTKSISSTLICIFIFQLVCCCGLRYFYNSYFHNPLGFNPVDAAFYDNFGNSVSLPYEQFIHKIKSLHLKIDDFGFPTIIYFIYKNFGENGRDILLLINPLIITLTSFFLYKTSLIFFDESKSSFICFFWGIEAFSICTAANGLKENFLLFFMVSAMYFLCKLYIRFTIKDTFLFVPLAFCTLFFRSTLFFAFATVFLMTLFVRDRFIKNNIWFFVVIVVVVVFINLIPILNMVLGVRGYSMDWIEYAQETKGSGFLQMSTNIIAALVGPFPNFISDEFKRNYITLYSFTPFTKMLYSLFFLYGMWYAIKNKLTEFFPFILMWLINTIMLLVMVFTLHDRFQWPHIPYTLILSCLGYEMLNKKRSRKSIELFYFVVVIAFIFIFNLRLG